MRKCLERGSASSPDDVHMYYVYIIKSLRDGRTYVGYTHNLENRLKSHNTSRVRSTSHRSPFILLHYEEFGIMSEAKERERWWKGKSGRKEMRRFFESAQ